MFVRSQHQVSRISTDIKTAGTCYTDSNGREMIYRKRHVFAALD
jgi:hypothetical protein